MKRYAIYVRVSTEEQSRPGHVSLDTQRHDCRRYVVERGGQVVLEEQDVQTGLDPTRSGYQRVLAAARDKEIDGVAAWRFDRWGRDAGEALQSFGQLQRLGVTVESVMEPTEDPFLQGLFALLGYRESQSIAMRTAAGLRTRATRGEWSGPPPLGYGIRREDGRSTLIPEPEIAHYIARLFEEAACGRYSLATLTTRITRAGLRSRRGHAISRQGIGRMLRNPAYRGAVVFGKRSQSRFRPIGRRPDSEWVVVEHAHPALTDTATFNAVQAWLTRHRKEQGMVRRSRFLLTSRVFCARCKGVDGRAWRAYGHGTKGAVYQCSRSVMYGACSLPSISAPGLEARIRSEVAENFTITQEMRARATRYIEEEAEAAGTAAERQRTDLTKALERHQDRRLALARRLLGDVGEAIPPDVYRRLEDEEVVAIRRLEMELASLPEEPPVFDTEPMLVALADLTWNDLSWDGWRQMLTLLVDRIWLYDRGHFEIEWQPAADVLRRALDRVSHFGSRTFG